MKMELDDSNLYIKLNPVEMFFSMHGSLTVPLKNIVQATTEKPGWEWGIRSPGTHIPFLLKSGTYQVSSGAEFWITTIGLPYLVIEIEGWHYSRVVMTMNENREWSEKINSIIQT